MAERKKDKDKDADSTDVNLKKIMQWYLKTFARC